MSTFRESDLPGIGRKFQINARSGDKLVIVIHDDGRREMHHFDYNDPDESISMVTLDDSEARRIGAILGGMVYMPKGLLSVDVAFEEMVIDWFKVEPDAKAIGKTIGDLRIRRKTGATIIAVIKKDHTKVINPGPDQIIYAGSILVILGERGPVKNCKHLITNWGIE